MYDVNDDEKDRLRGMAHVGHSVTDREAELLRRIADPVRVEAPREYPKMVYPEGAVHDDNAEPHLIGKPRGVLVNSEEEEHEALIHGERIDDAGVDPNASHGDEAGRLATTEEIERRQRAEHLDGITAAQRQVGAAAGQAIDPTNDPRSRDLSQENPTHSAEPTIAGKSSDQEPGRVKGESI